MAFTRPAAMPSKSTLAVRTTASASASLRETVMSPCLMVRYQCSTASPSAKSNRRVPETFWRSGSRPRSANLRKNSPTGSAVVCRFLTTCAVIGGAHQGVTPGGRAEGPSVCGHRDQHLRDLCLQDGPPHSGGAARVEPLRPGQRDHVRLLGPG